MEPIHVALVVLAGILIVLGVFFWRALKLDNDGVDVGVSAGTLIISGSLVLLVFLIVGWMALMPEYRLWRATIEKRILVEEARAQADSAVELARAEVERAKGTAEANLIVSNSITEPYLRYLYINSLAETQNQVIYLPTEAGLPILEADRFEQPVED